MTHAAALSLYWARVPNFKNLLLLGLLVLPTVVLHAASPLEDLTARLTDEARRKFATAGKPVDQWKPNGHEAADLLLASLSKVGPKRPLTTAERNGLQVPADEVLLNRVSLLAGYPVQDLGFPYDWFRAPKDDLQWPTHLSRHDYLVPLARMYAGTGEQKYANHLVAVLLDWMKKFPIGGPGLEWANGEGKFVKYSDGPWTSLSAHARIDSWLKLLPLIATADCMDNQTTALLLNALLSTHRQLMLDRPRAGTANQFLSVGASMLKFGIAFPQFATAEECRRVGLERVTQYAKTQIYEDGSVAECSPNYGIGSVTKLYLLALDLQERGIEVPPVIFERVRKAARYYALISTPLGRAPRIAKGRGDILKSLRDLNGTLKDPEVSWLVSSGAEGRKPAQLNYGFNWVGHFVMRSGWAPQDIWLFFEPGPRGSGHHDRAQLGIQLMAGGSAILVDPGYYTYSTSGEEGLMYKYLSSTFGHNTAVVDGAGQNSTAVGQKQLPNTNAGDYKWTATDDAAAAEGAYTFGYGEGGKIGVTHKRRVSFARQAREFTVQDSFTGAGSHTYDILWQAPPNAKIEINANRVTIQTESAAATLDFESTAPLKITSVSGSRDPLAGWYSETYGKLEPSTTIRVSMTGKRRFGPE